MTGKVSLYHKAVLFQAALLLNLREYYTIGTLILDNTLICYLRVCSICTQYKMTPCLFCYLSPCDTAFLFSLNIYLVFSIAVTTSYYGLDLMLERLSYLHVLWYKSHYVYLFICLKSLTPPTVLNVENSKLACQMIIRFHTLWCFHVSLFEILRALFNILAPESANNDLLMDTHVYCLPYIGTFFFKRQEICLWIALKSLLT